jgi:ribosomal protein S20
MKPTDKQTKARLPNLYAQLNLAPKESDINLIRQALQELANKVNKAKSKEVIDQGTGKRPMALIRR